MPYSDPIIRKEYAHAHYVKHYTKKVQQARESRFRRVYGITSKEWDEMFERQGFKCPVCQTTEDSRWAVDHDHVTGEVRGILCGPCNRGIGLLGDNSQTLIAAATYLHWFKSGRIVPQSIKELEPVVV